jgi:lipopolysaccharide exporter
VTSVHTREPTSVTPVQLTPAIGTERLESIGATSLRSHAARGVLVNAGFSIAVSVLGLLKGLLLASFLSVSAYAVWGLIAVTYGTLFWLAAVGLDDKYIQQDHADERAAFQLAFTLQSLLCAGLMALALVAVPAFALAYGRPEMIVPGLVTALVIPALALQTPLWIFWRRMEFRRQRSLLIWDPLISLAVTAVLAAAGVGLWSAVIGTLAGGWLAAVIALRACPYALRLRYEPGAFREYASFSWPLFVSSASAVLIAQVPTVIASRSLGLAAVGALGLAGSIALFANRVDEIVTQVLYPTICAVKDRTDLLFEAFSKSNRLALLWAAPLGAAGVLFAPDLVDHVIGEKWDFAVFVIQVVALCAAVNQIGFNWTAFYRARGETRPIAVASVVVLAAVFLIAIPLLAWEGLDAFAAGWCAAIVAFVAVRLYYLARLFPALRIGVHVGRAVAPTFFAVPFVLAVRVATGGPRGVGQPLAELGLFGCLVAIGTFLAERGLLREARGYLRRARRSAEAASPA